MVTRLACPLLLLTFLVPLPAAATVGENTVIELLGYDPAERKVFALAHAEEMPGLLMLGADALLRSHYLFLGHSLSDWNLRMVAHRLFGGDRLSARSWAVRPTFDELGRKLWDRHGVTLVECDLASYIKGLDAWVSTSDARRAAP